MKHDTTTQHDDGQRDDLGRLPWQAARDRLADLLADLDERIEQAERHARDRFRREQRRRPGRARW